MKEIEINSDKYTVIAICFGLAFCLFSFLSSLYGLIANRSVAHPHIGLGDYTAAFLTAYLALMAWRDSQFRKKYPYGIAGVCGMAAGFFILIAMDWTSASVERWNFADTIREILNAIDSGLFLIEGARWLKKNVRVSADV